MLELAEEPLSRAEQGYREASDQTRLGAALVLRSALTSIQGDFPHAFALARQAISMLPEQEIKWRGPCLGLLETEAALAGKTEPANQLLQQSLVLCQTAGSLPGILFATAWLGEVRLGQGKLRQAASFFRQVLATSNKPQELMQSQLTLETGTREIYYERLALYSLALLAYEWNDLVEAGRTLHEALSQGQFVWFHILIPGLLLQVRLLCLQDKAQQA